MAALRGATAHDEDAEKRIIAAIFFDPSLCEKIRSRGITAESFYKANHRLLATAIFAAADAGEEPDEIAAEEQLVQSGDFESVGGRAYVNSFTLDAEMTAATSQWQHFATVIRKCEDQRALAKALMRAEEATNNGDLEAARQLLADIPVPEEDSSSQAFVDWQPIFDAGMEPPKPSMVQIEGGSCLLYEGRMNEGHGEHSVGKTNVSCVIAATAVREGKTVLYIDPEDNPQGIGSRLESFGLTREQIKNQVIYSQFEPDFWPDYYRVAKQRNVHLAIFDGIAEGMSAHSLSERDESEVLEFFRRFRPFKKAGIALWVTDHVVKDTESRNLWSRGSGAKLAHYDGASFYLETGKGYTPTESGFVRLKVAKDRSGGVGKKGETVAEIHFAPHEFLPGKTEVSIRKADTGYSEDKSEWRPTALMERVKAYLEAHPGATVKDLRSLGQGKYVTKAINILVADGEIRTEPGPRNAVLHYLVEPEEESDQQPEQPEQPEQQ